MDIIKLIEEGAEKWPDNGERLLQDAQIHASQLAEWCPRQYLYAERDRKAIAAKIRTCKELFGEDSVDLVKQKIPAKLRFLFERGNAYHDLARECLKLEGSLYGNWQCLVCNDMTEGLLPEDCKECGASGLFEYHEMSATRTVNGLKVIGHCDAFVKAGKIIPVVEIKSKNHDAFQFVAAADPKHLTQMLVYMWLFKSRAGCILYIGEDMAMKQFWFEWNPKFGIWIEDMLTALTTYSTPQDAPRACMNETCVQAKKCLWRKECFRT